MEGMISELGAKSEGVMGGNWQEKDEDNHG